MSFEALRREVIERGLCARCGLCVGVCPPAALGLSADFYPRLVGRCTDCGLCNRVCPGADVDFPALARRVFGAAYDPRDPWGRQSRLVVAHPTDEGVRRNGASGGVVTALLLYLLRTGRIRGAAVVGMDAERPYRPRSRLATREEEIRAAAKSKYCMVPSLDVLAEMRGREGPFAVVALPCQVHGLRKLEEADPALAGKIGYILALYCHYNMEHAGYLDALRVLNIDPEQIAAFEFRGGGWPGGFLARMKDGSERALHTINIKNIMTVMLRLYGAQRCFLCTDALGEFGDLGLGDFWAIDYAGRLGELGWCTLVSERTPRGRELLLAAEREGAVRVYELPPARYSKRTRNFALEKKAEGFVRLRRRARQGRPAPDYHYPIPRAGARAWLVEALYRTTRVLRAPARRRLALRLLFSPAGAWIDRLNTVRKRICLRFHGN